MKKSIPLSVPNLKGNEWTYVKECLDTSWVSSAGPFVERFEEQLCRFVGAKHAVACVNGTSALQIALQVAGVQAGDEVIVPTLTFIATINAVKYLGAVPVFMDSDEYYNLDVTKVAEFLDQKTDFANGVTVNRRTGRRISAIVPVHVFGNAARLDALLSICRDRGIRMIEDATESLGTVYSAGALKGRHTGTIGDLGCFSFNGNKIITTGGGGMIVTDRPQFAQRARHLTTQAKSDEVRYVHDEVGYNFRLTNLQAALGVAQLEQLPGFIETKRRNFALYSQAVKSIAGLKVISAPDYAQNNYWMYALQIDAATYGRDREALMAYLSEAGIQTRPVWHLNHLQKPYADCEHYRIELALEQLKCTLNLPCSTNLTAEDVGFICERLSHHG